MSLEDIMLNEISQTRKSKSLCGLSFHVESTKFKLIKAESKIAIARGKGGEDNGWRWGVERSSKGSKFQYIRGIKFRNLLRNMVITVNVL